MDREFRREIKCIPDLFRSWGWRSTDGMSYCINKWIIDIWRDKADITSEHAISIVISPDCSISIEKCEDIGYEALEFNPIFEGYLSDPECLNKIEEVLSKVKFNDEC